MVQLGCSDNGKDKEVIVEQFDTKRETSDASNEPSIPNLRVKVEPVDLTTSMRTLPIKLIVGLVNREVPDATLDELGKRVTLYSSETGEQIPVTFNILPSEESVAREVAVKPVEELPSQWLEVRLDLRALPLDGYHALVPTGDGTFKSRFHPDSVPVVQKVQACFDQQYAGNVGVRIDFSELIDFIPKPSTVSNPPAHPSLGSGTCKMDPNVQDNEPDQYASVFQFSCVGVQDASELLLVFDSVLKTETGQILTTYRSADAPKSISLRLSDAYDAGECKVWHLP